MQQELDRSATQLPASDRRLQAERESAAIIGFISAVAAYGAFYIPKAYGSSIGATGGAEAALWAFLVFFASCVVLTWLAYSGPPGRSRYAAKSAAPRVPMPEGSK